MSAFDTARDLRLPGVVLTRAFVDPARMSTRMKNLVKKMIRQGHTEGGWNSKAKQLAQKLAECYGLVVVSRNLHGFSVPDRRLYSDEIATRVVELIDADRALYLMDMGDCNPVYRASVEDRYTGARAKVLEQTPEYYGRWVSIQSAQLCAQCCDLFATSRSPEVIEAAEKMCERIDNGDHIDISIRY